MDLYDWTPVFNPSADEEPVEVKNRGEARLVAMDAYNPGADMAYLQLFGKPEANVTLGTTVPDWVFPIPPGGGRDMVFPHPPVFAAGLTYAVTATANGAGAPSAACQVSLVYL